MWWKHVVFWAKVAAAIWVGLVGLLEVLTRYEVVEPNDNLQPTVWVISLIILGVGSVGELIGEAVKNRFAEKKGRYDAALMSMVIELCRDGTLRFEDLGGSVYRRARWRRTVTHEDGTKSQRLKRVHRFRPSAYPPPSGITWTARTGAVGECWEKHRHIYKDWHAVASKYPDPLTATEYARVSKSTKNGFTLEEFNSIARKYSELLAVPIYDPLNDEKQLGVLSVDRLFDSEQSFAPVLGKEPKQRLVFAASATIGSILKPQAKND
ncbi:hypothetical protein LQ938_11885 [Microbacterium sp. cx-55]|uniref:hypothetical protein n=1 Tax=Microbacterium sp. cx-55 TaxID=2875948 RepID=UPI001CC1B3F5|nr:hypothetical protein [Microbacterium sp. cx-55]MBZ4488029.1 hypothetical protein [Microbacterium sp. cx-55]UGB34565.1 hypothetical protein LQ938_11885 [Microbacterium sp. cx-55]